MCWVVHHSVFLHLPGGGAPCDPEALGRDLGRQEVGGSAGLWLLGLLWGEFWREGAGGLSHSSQHLS